VSQSNTFEPPTTAGLSLAWDPISASILKIFPIHLQISTVSISRSVIASNIMMLLIVKFLIRKLLMGDRSLLNLGVSLLRSPLQTLDRECLFQISNTGDRSSKAILKKTFKGCRTVSKLNRLSLNLTVIASYLTIGSAAAQGMPLQISDIDVLVAQATANPSSFGSQPNSLPGRLIAPPTPPSQAPLPEIPLPRLPAPEELLPPPQVPTTPEQVPGEAPAAVFVERYNVVGSTVFSPQELAEVTAPFAGREITFTELLQARSAVTQLYVDRGYVTSGAFIPPQTLEGGVVTIQVLEGTLEAINVTGTRRLNPGYVRSRLNLAATTPLNVPRLLRGLQLLQLDPLIQTISADLQTGTRSGSSLLQVQVKEADSFNTQVGLNNGRSSSVGSFRRQIQFNQANLLGLGDGLTVAYLNTDGSNEVDASYTLPLNPRNGTLQLAFGLAHSNVIEPPFESLGIESTSRYYELTLRQPLFQTPNEEFDLGLIASRQESETTFAPLGTERRPFVTTSTDPEGRTRVSALRFFQEWTQRSSQHVLAFRSQFSLGLNLLDATISDTGADSRFFAWRGQGQWVRLLAPDLLLLVRSDAQLADSALVPLEQFGLGGQQSVRGYQQDLLLTDNGALLSAEVRLPILRIPRIRGVLQVVPFLDLGTAWNNGTVDPDPNTLAGLGLGLLWQQGDNFSARLDWGIPLIRVDGLEKRTWQENGIYFSITYSPF
jgi:hemolysin activation/secretion protein